MSMRILSSEYNIPIGRRIGRVAMKALADRSEMNSK